MAVTEPTAADSPRSTAVSVGALVTLLAVAVVAYVLDQVSKYFVVANLPLGESVPVLGEVLQFFYVKNSGAAFSLASGYTWVFSIAASAVVVFIAIFARRIRSTGWAILFGMLLGGTLGNLTDRLFREPSFGLGHVVDFLQVIYFPAIFNIADSFIVASMGLFIILTIRGVRLDGSLEQKVEKVQKPLSSEASEGSAIDSPGTAEPRPAEPRS